jgi:hypothetical protein
MGTTGFAQRKKEDQLVTAYIAEGLGRHSAV